MIKKLFISLSVIFLIAGVSLAQETTMKDTIKATIKGTVKDLDGNPLQYAQVFLEQDEKIVNMATADEKGEYQMLGVIPGTYNIKATGKVPCNNTLVQKDVTIRQGEVKVIDFKIPCVCGEGNYITIIYHKPPVFDTSKSIYDPSKTTSSVKLTRDEVAKLTGRAVSMSYWNSTNGENSNIKGNRNTKQRTSDKQSNTKQKRKTKR